MPQRHDAEMVEEMKRADPNRRVDVSASRAGAHPGTHEVGFDSAADTITLRHTARSREGFRARSARRGALGGREKRVVRVSRRDFCDP